MGPGNRITNTSRATAVKVLFIEHHESGLAQTCLDPSPIPQGSYHCTGPMINSRGIPYLTVALINLPCVYVGQGRPSTDDRFMAGSLAWFGLGSECA